MMSKILTACAVVAVSVTAAAAQGETTATQPKIYMDNNDDASKRLPLAGKADPADLFKNVDGSRGTSKSTSDLNKTIPAITEHNNDDAEANVTLR